MPCCSLALEDLRGAIEARAKVGLKMNVAQDRLDDVLDAVPRRPVLMIQGDADQVAPLHSALKLASRSPYPSMHIIRGAGHHPIHTHTEFCLRLAGRHLDGENYPVLHGEEDVVAVPPAFRIS